MRAALLSGAKTAPWWVLALEAAEGAVAPWEMPGSWLVWWVRWEKLREARWEARELSKG